MLIIENSTISLFKIVVFLLNIQKLQDCFHGLKILIKIKLCSTYNLIQIKKFKNQKQHSEYSTNILNIILYFLD